MLRADEVQEPIPRCHVPRLCHPDQREGTQIVPVLCIGCGHGFAVTGSTHETSVQKDDLVCIPSPRRPLTGLRRTIYISVADGLIQSPENRPQAAQEPERTGVLEAKRRVWSEVDSTDPILGIDNDRNRAWHIVLPRGLFGTSPAGFSDGENLANFLEHPCHGGRGPTSLGCDLAPGWEGWVLSGAGEGSPPMVETVAFGWGQLIQEAGGGIHEP